MASSSSYASSRIREVEHRSASACKYESSTVSITDDGWKIHTGDTDFAEVQIPSDKMAEYASGNSEPIVTEGDDVNGVKLVKCQMLAAGTSIRVAPMERSCGGWSTEHFHEHLRLPEGASAGKGMVVMLEAMGRECIAIALSPYHEYQLGKTYVAHLGANGNLQTVIRRHTNYQECVDMTVPCRVCAQDTWIPYWIILQGGKLSAGVGRVPGKNCIGTLDDSMYNMVRSGVDAVKYVGISNSALQRTARDLRVRNVMVMTIPPHFGLEGIPIQESKFVNILEMNHGIHGNAGSGGVMQSDAELLAEYEKERDKARKRSEKFGIEYKEPAPDAFLKWSEARRLRANPERGFITGIDTFSATEKAKADARKERFARDERKQKRLDPDGDGSDADDNQDGDEEAMEDDEGVDDVAEWEKTKKDPLPIDQAWENFKLVEQFRADAPKGLLTNTDGTGEIKPSGSFPSDIWHGNGGDVNNEQEEGGKEFIPRKVVIVPTKIHIFSIDWAPFKQIRTDDLMSYFRDYGPSYVEWLGELSCNVLFEDKHSAARAFHALSQGLPSPPPESLTNPTPPAAEDSKNANMEEDIKERWTNINDEDNGDDAEADKETSMDSTNDIDDNKEGVKEAEGVDEAPEEKTDQEKPLPDYGGLGWRFCKWTVRKVSNDRYGRRGTRARVLMRLATSMDILDDRPTEWPKPPPGFTTKRVLMPWHDYSGKRRHQRAGRKDNKRRRRGGSGGGRNSRGNDDDNVEERMSKGLKSGRGRTGGFSVEELEAERNTKNAEILS